MLHNLLVTHSHISQGSLLICESILDKIAKKQDCELNLNYCGFIKIIEMPKRKNKHERKCAGKVHQYSIDQLKFSFALTKWDFFQYHFVIYCGMEIAVLSIAREKYGTNV